MLRKLINGVLAVFLVVGFLGLFFHTDFGLTSWAPTWLQWCVIILIPVWWIGYFVWIIRHDN